MTTRKGSLLNGSYCIRDNYGCNITRIIVEGFIGDTRNAICCSTKIYAFGYHDIYSTLLFFYPCRIEFHRIRFETVICNTEMKVIRRGFMNKRVSMRANSCGEGEEKEE